MKNGLFIRVMVFALLLLCQSVSAATLSLDTTGKYLVNPANISTIIKNFRRPDIINAAIYVLGKGVDYVMNPANNQVRFKKPVQNYDIVFCEPYLNPKCFDSPQQLFAHYHQQNYANHPGYRNVTYGYFFDKNGKNSIQLIQNGSRSEYGYIYYEGDANAYADVWNHHSFEYQTKLVRKENPNGGVSSNEQTVSYDELAVHLLNAANQGDSFAKRTLTNIDTAKPQTSTVIVQKPTTPTKPQNPPVATQPKPVVPVKPIANPKPVSTPVKPIIKKSKAQCVKEWDDAYKMCDTLIKSGKHKGVTGGYTNRYQCAKGLVSQACGGNKVK